MGQKNPVIWTFYPPDRMVQFLINKYQQVISEISDKKCMFRKKNCLPITRQILARLDFWLNIYILSKSTKTDNQFYERSDFTPT